MAGQAAAIGLFFLITLGIGYGTLWLSRAKRDANPLIALLEILAVGIATTSLVGVVLKLIHIPLHYTVYLALALACPLTAFGYAIKDKRIPESLAKLKQGWTLTATACVIIAILAGAFVFGMFHKGAFSYPYLEDDDPWQHAQATAYIATERTYDIDPAVRELNPGYAFYLEPYPPTFDVLMGILRQANDSTVWTLKFFNALLCGIAILFVFLAARAYLGSDTKAAFAAVTIAVLPSFMSHFIWSQTLALVIFPVALYASIKAFEDRSWLAPAIIAVASMLVTQPVVSLVFGVTLLLLVAFVFLHELTQPKGKKSKTSIKTLLARFPESVNGLAVGAGGLLLSFIVYWIPQILKWTWAGFLKLRGAELTTGWGGAYALQTYNLWTEVINAPMAGRIDQPVGWGLALTVILVLGVIAILASGARTLNPRKGWRHLHLLLWSALLTYAILAPSFGLPGWGASRTWAYLAIPLVMLAAEGASIIARSITRKDAMRAAILLVFLIAIIATSFPAKWSQQTNPGWPPGAHWTATQAANGAIEYPELRGYLQMQQLLPAGTAVYPFCLGDQHAIGFDMVSKPWDIDVARFRYGGLNHTPQETIDFLTSEGYQYVTFTIACVRDHGENTTTKFVQDLSATGRLQLTHQDNGFLLARIV